MREARPARRPPIPPCEACGQEPTTSFSWFLDPARRYAPRSGTWKFTGDCTAHTEAYYVMLHHRGTGFLDSVDEQRDWLRHLFTSKDWFDRADWAAMLARYEAAGGTLSPRTSTPRDATELWCLACGTSYATGLWWRIGGPCGDHPPEQAMPCPGRLQGVRDVLGARRGGRRGQLPGRRGTENL